MKETLRILIVEPGKHPRAATIPNTLKATQEVVGGHIQAIYPWMDKIALVCDEDGLLKGYEFNRLVRNNIIVGTFFICGLCEEDFDDLPEKLMAKYSRRYYMPEKAVKRGLGIYVYKVEPWKGE